MEFTVVCAPVPLVTVVIPVYNGEKTIRQTIDSVLSQTFVDFELIVINDGSQDATLSVVESIDDARVRVLSYANGGPSASRNRGIQRARGQYICFIDADDQWTPDKLETQFNALQSNPQAAVAYSWTNYIDELGNSLNQGPRFTFSGDVFAPLLLTDFIGCGSNPMIRMDTLQAVGLFDESLIYAEDWEMWLRLAAHYPFVATPHPQVLYRISSNSQSSNLAGMATSSFKVLDKAFDQAPESIQRLKSICIANRAKGFIFRALTDGAPNRDRILTAMGCMYHAAVNDPAFIRTRIFWKVALKIAIALLPSSIADRVLAHFRSLSHLDALFVHMKIEAIL